MTRAQVRNLEERSAAWVAKHLVMAGRLIDDDPELAFQHALAASRRGGRLAAVREAVGLTAYAAGHYGEALREFRTFRRISGSNVHLPVMADCERGLGRPDRALDLARTDEATSLDVAGTVELAMVVSGARADLGQTDAAVSALEIPQLDLHRAFSYSPRLFRAYADALDAAGRSGESGKWRRQAEVADKALGIVEDTEPDIIDLGDDDEPDSSAVPRVADVLAPTTPVAHAEKIPDPDAVKHIAPAADEVPHIDPHIDPNTDPAADPDIPPGVGVETADVFDSAAESDYVAGPIDEVSEGEIVEEEAIGLGDHGEIQDAPPEISTDGTTRGRTTPDAPLQTETLFNMDGVDTQGALPADAGAERSDTDVKKAPRKKAPKRETPLEAPEGQDVIDE